MDKRIRVLCDLIIDRQFCNFVDFYTYVKENMGDLYVNTILMDYKLFNILIKANRQRLATNTINNK